MDLINISDNLSVFKISVVKELTDLSERQIRYYDQQGLVVPKRTNGNTRLYSPAEVERLNGIKKLIKQGMKLKEVKNHLDNKKNKLAEKNSDASIYFNQEDANKSLYPPSYLDEIINRLSKN